MESLGPHGLAVVVDLLDSVELGSGGIHIVVTDRPRAVRAEVQGRCPPGWVPSPLLSAERDRLSEAAYAREREHGALLVDVVDPRSEGERAALRALNDYREVLLRRGTAAVVIVGGKDSVDADAAYLRLQAQAPDFWSVRNRVHRVTGPDSARSMTDALLQLLSPRFGGDRAAARRWLDRRPVAEEWVTHRLWREGPERAAWLAAAAPARDEAASIPALEHAFIVAREHPLLDESPIGEAIAPERWPRPRRWAHRLDAEQQALVQELAAAFERDGVVELRLLPEDVDPEALTAAVLAWSLLESRHDLVLHIDARAGLEGAIARCLRDAGDTTSVSGIIDVARRLQGALGDARALLLITDVAANERDLVAGALRGRAIVATVRSAPHATFCVVASASHEGIASWARGQLSAWSGGATVQLVREETVLLDLRMACSAARHPLWMMDASWRAWPSACERLFETTAPRSAALALDDAGLPEVASAITWQGPLGSDETRARERLGHVARTMAGEPVAERLETHGPPWPGGPRVEPATEARAAATEEPLAVEARRLFDESLYLGELGKREEALASAEEAVELRRALAKQRPDAFMPDLAMSLNNLGNRQSELGKREEALASAEEAVERYRALAKQRPDAFGPDLAMSLNNLSVFQSELGKREEALASAEEAVVCFQQLFLKTPAAFHRNFTIILRNYRAHLTALGRAPENDPIVLSAVAALERAGLAPS